MRRGRKVLLGTGGFLFLLIVALAILVVTFDWNRARPWIDDKVSQAIGRPFAINGDLTVQWRRDPNGTGLSGWVPWPTFTARNITIVNPGWTKQPVFGQLDAVEFRLSPLPLFARRVVVPSVRLVAPRVDLERVADGRDNWTFTMPQGGSSDWTMDLGEVGFAKGHIDLSDQSSQVVLSIDVTPLDHAIPFSQILAEQTATSREQANKTVHAGAAHSPAPAPSKDVVPTQAYAFAWDAKGSYKGASVVGTGKTGGVLALRDARRPLPVQADMRFGDTHIAVVGTLTDPANLGALDMRLWLSGSSMAKLYALTGVTLPDTPPFATEGHLVAQLHRSGSTYTYENFTGRVGGSDLGGSLAYTNGGPRPKLTGTVHSRLLQFDDLAPLIGADSNAEKQNRGDGTTQPEDKALPVEPFRTDRWQAMDADVQFAGERIVRSGALPIDTLQTHLTLTNGLLALDPLKFGLAGGNVEGSVQLDGRAAPMKGTLQLAARHLKLKQLFPTFAPMKTSFGEINSDIALSATGNSVSALLAGSNGQMKLLMNDGAISKTLLETAGLNVGNIVIGRLFGDKVVKINCAASDLVATNGLLDARLFALDTEDALINVDGTVDFRSEKLDLNVRPHTKGMRVISLRSPLYVKGTLKNPDVGVKPGPLILRGGGALVLAVFAAPAAVLLPLIVPSNNSDENSCQTMLAQMRGAPEAPPAGKTMKVRPLPEDPKPQAP
jgi:AsmA family protein